MYGPSSKLGGGRGGGRGGGGMKRLSSSFPPPPAQRPSSAANSSRLSLRPASSSNPRNRPDGLSNSSSSGAAAAASGNAVEETFSLMPGNNPPAFAMIIRLAPDLVEEIRRVEAQGGSARIKFDSGANNTSGNVIDVGGKEFRFTWSRELGDLCDIYEQRQSGEDGNGLLVESGCAWRKVTVQRILDESTKNHVKMLSEEAERKLKSRKAIVLDHQTPSMQNQMKQLQAAESNPWRMPFKQKKDHPNKKRKVEPPQGGGPPKSTLKAVSASNSSVKGRHSLSPLPTTPEQSAAPSSPFGAASVTKSHMNPEVVTATQTKSKENTNASEKVIPLRPPGTVGEIPGRKENFGAKPTDLQSMLITLLMENPKGMSLKALEKAVGEMIPNFAEKIEPIIKKIANFQASGRYILKQGVELESFKKPSSESGSSPEDNHRQMLPSEDNLDQRPAPEPRYAGKSPAGQLGEQALSDSKLREDSNAAERIEIEHPSPDLFGEKKGSDNSEGSSSDSGSDSDSESDSSDSGSDSGSHSRSRSRSPVGSGSGSSSDSESDASSNSEGSDVDVDIMTSDDDKEPQHKSQAYEPGFQASQDPWRSLPNGTEEKQDGDGSDAIDIEGNGSAAVDIEGHESDAVNLEKDLADNEKENETAANHLYTPSKEGGDHVEEVKSLSPEHDTIQDRQTYIGNLFEDNENTIQDFAQEQSDSSERISKGKSKRASDMKRCDEKSENAKRFKQNSAQVPIFGGLNGQFLDSSPGRNAEDNYKDPAAESMNRANREGNDDFGSEKGYNQTFPGRNSSNFQQSGRRFSDQSGRAKVPDTTGLSKHTESSGHGRKSSEKGSHMHEAFPFQREKPSRDMQNEDSFGKEKKLARNTKDVDVVGRHSGHSETHYRKRGEIFGKSKDTTQLSISHTGSSPIDSNRADMDRHPAISGRSLQRELSDLELGELRESLPEETPAKRQFERKGSFKLLENKQNASDNGNSDLSKGKPTGKAALNSGKPSSPGGVEHNVEDLTRSRPKAGLPHQQHFPRDNAENGNQFSKSVDASIRQRQKEIGTKIGNSMEGYGESHKKAPAGAQQQHEPKRGQLSHSMKETKTQMYNTGTDLSNGQKDTMLSEGNNAQKRRESSSEDDSFPFAKYEKDAPELKGPIKDFSQYKEYAQEYRDKYDSYCSLNVILESYRNEFQQLGKDLEFSKGKDMERYHKVVQQLKESYRLCGARHKRHKKVFIVLHEELKHLKQRIIDYARTVQL